VGIYWRLDLVRYDRCMNDFNAGNGVLRDMIHFIWEFERPRKVVEMSVWDTACCPLNEASRPYNGKEALLGDCS
jgi:hypothetical protein